MSRRLAPLLAGLCCAFALATPVAAPAATRLVPQTPTTVAVYATALRKINPEMPDWQSRNLARELLSNAEHWKIDANMLAAIVTVESGWHTTALSYAGAIGLGQLMPGTAATLGINPHDPSQNLKGAAKYLSGLMRTFGANPRRFELVFAAYNAGPKAVIRYGGIPPYGETQHYVVKVLRAWHHLATTVRLPAELGEETVAQQAHGADVDYWVSGSR